MSGKFWAHSAGPVCIAHPAHPIATPLVKVKTNAEKVIEIAWHMSPGHAIVTPAMNNGTCSVFETRCVVTR